MSGPGVSFLRIGDFKISCLAAPLPPPSPPSPKGEVCHISRLIARFKTEFSFPERIKKPGIGREFEPNSSVIPTRWRLAIAAIDFF